MLCAPLRYRRRMLPIRIASQASLVQKRFRTCLDGSRSVHHRFYSFFFYVSCPRIRFRGTLMSLRRDDLFEPAVVDSYSLSASSCITTHDSRTQTYRVLNRKFACQSQAIAVSASLMRFNMNWIVASTFPSEHRSHSTAPAF